MRVRLLPWRPRWRRPSWDGADGANAIGDVGGDDIGLGLLVIAGLLLLPLLLAVLFLAAQLAVVLAVVPLLMTGQLLGVLPWVLVLTDSAGSKRFVEVRGLRSLLAERRRLRAQLV